MSIAGTPNWALTVKDYRADFVHAPFPEILSSRVLLFSRPAVRSSKPCE